MQVMDIVKNNTVDNKVEQRLENKLGNNKNLEVKQNNFLNSKLGKAINIGIDLGIRALLPDLIENEVIALKNTIIAHGFKQGVKKGVEDATNLGKSAVGIVTGEFETIDQAHKAVKRGGILDTVSDSLGYAISESTRKGLIDRNVGSILRNGKNVLINSVNSKIEDNFELQIKSFEKLEKYSKNWERYYNERNFEGMELELKKIKNEEKNILPLKNVFNNIQKIENMNRLIKSRNYNFNLTEEELKLAKLLV